MFLELAENEMLLREPLQPLPQPFRYNNEDVQNVFVVGTCRAQCVYCTGLKFPNDSAGMCCNNEKKNDLRPLSQSPQSLAAVLLEFQKIQDIFR